MDNNVIEARNLSKKYKKISEEFTLNNVVLQDLRNEIPSLEDVFVSAIHEKLAESGKIRKVASEFNVKKS